MVCGQLRYTTEYLGSETYQEMAKGPTHSSATVKQCSTEEMQFKLVGNLWLVCHDVVTTISLSLKYAHFKTVIVHFCWCSGCFLRLLVLLLLLLVAVAVVVIVLETMERFKVNAINANRVS